MNHSGSTVRKLVCAASVLLGGIAIASCGPAENWTYSDEELMKATEVRTSIQMDSVLRINLMADEAIFKTSTPAKECVFIAPKVSESSNEGGKVTFEQLKKNRIEDFKIDRCEDKVLTVSFENYDITTYYVFVGKTATANGDIVLGTASLVSYSFDCVPVFGLDSETFYSGQTNPDILISVDNAEIADKTKISFDGAFANLTAGEMSEAEGQLTLKTTGTVSDKSNGIITLREGFFKDITGDIPLYADVLRTAVYVDQATFALEGKDFTFDIKSSSSDYVNTFGSNALSFSSDLDKIAVKSLERSDDKTMKVTVSLNGSGFESVGDVLEYLDGSPLALSDALKDIPGSFPIPLAVNYPSLSVYPSLDLGARKLTISARLYNSQTATFTQDDFQLENSNVDIDGDDKNVTLASFEPEANGFRVTYDLLENFGSRVYGTLSIPATKAKALWGEGYRRSRTFDSAGVLPLRNTDDEHPEIQESFEETVVKTHLDWDDGQKIILTAGYLMKIGISLTEEHYDSAFGSFIDIFKVFGLTGHSNEPTVQDVLNKLNNMDQKLDNLSHQLDKLGETIDIDTAALALGIDRILYNQYQTNWNNFLINYKDKMEDMIRNFQSKFRQGFVDLINSEDSVSFMVGLIEKDGKYLSSTMDPNNPLYSTEGVKFDVLAGGSIDQTYFEEARQDYLANHRYSENFDTLFKKGIDAYLVDHPSSNYDSEQIYGAIVDTINFKSITQDETLDFTNLVINYSRAISGAAGKTCLSDYYNMMECFYNFQSETQKLFTTAAASLKQDLVYYAVFAQNFAKYSGAQIDRDTLKETVAAADDLIASYDGLHSLSAGTNYAYALNSKVAGKMVSVSFEVYFTSKGTNNCVFHADLSTWEMTGTIGRQGIGYVNNGTLLSRNDLLKLFQRYQNLGQSGVSVASSFQQYMIDSGILPSNAQAIYDAYKGYATAETYPSGFPVITSFDGVQGLSNENFKINCKSVGNGDYFNEATNYSYKGKDAHGDTTQGSGWSGQEAKGTVLDLNSMGTYTGVLDRYARYDESHWYWSHDEHHGFEMYNQGLACAAFIRV